MKHVKKRACARYQHFISFSHTYVAEICIYETSKHCSSADIRDFLAQVVHLLSLHLSPPLDHATIIKKEKFDYSELRAALQGG